MHVLTTRQRQHRHLHPEISPSRQTVKTATFYSWFSLNNIFWSYGLLIFMYTTACEVAYCGSGGTCKNGTGLSYHCECKQGFSNLLNMTTMPCFQECKTKNDTSNFPSVQKNTAYLTSNSWYRFRLNRSRLCGHRDPSINKLTNSTTTTRLR